MSHTNGTITSAPFGTTPDGLAVELYTLRNAQGMEVQITNFGGIVTTLKVPDKHGRLGDVVLGYDNLAGYLKETPYFGALVGRYGNRIANGRFTVGGKTYQLATNNGPNALHGGLKGFDKVVWSARVIETPEGPALVLTYLSKDGEEGYPGNLAVTATHRLTADNGLKIELSATTDRPTVCNLTHHSYFNLRGNGDVLEHTICLNADAFTPVDADLIPTGELRPVAGTPFDFRASTAIGARIEGRDEQIQLGRGYDHNWVVNKPDKSLGLAATVYEPGTGRVLEVYTTAPGVQFYTANFLDGKITGKGGWVYQPRHAFCLEPQHFPDSPNHPEFPSTELKPGEVYRHTIIYKFSVR